MMIVVLGVCHDFKMTIVFSFFGINVIVLS
jgi:hypothetical protein